MKIFVAASYSSKVNYKTGEVFEEYRYWLEKTLNIIESNGHIVFCSLREDNYRINDIDPAEALNLDLKRLKESEVLLALLDNRISGGVQTEIGVAVAEDKLVVLVHEKQDDLIYVNDALVKAKLAQELVLPFNNEKLASILS